MTLLQTKTHRLAWPIMATALVVSWSSGFVGIRYASENADVMLVLFWRTLMSGLILLPFALLIGSRISGRALIQQMAFGMAMMFLYLGGFALAIGQRVPTGLVALISDPLSPGQSLSQNGLRQGRDGERHKIGNQRDKASRHALTDGKRESA